jgi:cyclophilin family peptidyl-prolyl cis-trans isomerase
LGDIVDQFHPDIQHTQPGTLSYANSGDDSGDSQFFITDNHSPMWYLSLDGSSNGSSDGSPTGGSFSITYEGETTDAIAFSSAADMNELAESMEDALESLSTIGAGNVEVTHHPSLNSTFQLTDPGDRFRWKISFVEDLEKARGKFAYGDSAKRDWRHAAPGFQSRNIRPVGRRGPCPVGDQPGPGQLLKPAGGDDSHPISGDLRRH